ncbi:hypothetical protein ACGF4C_07275 [Streptomyces sp. NPDC048197]|uniref:hypothetical protein n=1 Tax=Streptomyces sp. NPDC048197 TaxID=3365511 RepID=UPI003718E855
MDRYEGRAQLAWWANRSTCLAQFPVRVAAAPDGDGWTAVVSPPLEHDAHEALQLLLESDPVCTLRTSDGFVTTVTAEHSGDLTRLRLNTFPDT